MGIFAGCTKYKDQKKAVSGFAKVYCDESFKNILEQEISIFEYQYPQSNVMARYMSESAALDSLLNKNVDLIYTCILVNPIFVLVFEKLYQYKFFHLFYFYVDKLCT